MKIDLRSTNHILGILITVLTTLAIVAAVISGNAVKSLPAGSPQLAVQEYLQLVTDGRNDLASRYFSKDSKCMAEDIDRAYLMQSFQVSLLRVEIYASTATVHVVIEGESSIFSDYSYDEKKTFRLIKESGLWKLTGIPWPLYDCGLKI